MDRRKVPILLQLYAISLGIGQSLCSGHPFRHVLAIPTPSLSHSLTMARLCTDLQEYQGYKTTIVLTEQVANHEALANISLNVVVSKGMGKLDSFATANTRAKMAFEGTYTKDMSVGGMFGAYIRRACEYALTDKDLLKDLGSQKFDIAIVDNIYSCTCFSVLPYKLDIPFVHYGRKIEVTRMRVTINPSVYPLQALGMDATDEMTFLERLSNTLKYIQGLLNPDVLTPYDVVGKYAPEKPHLSNTELQAQTQLYLLDVDVLMDYHLPAYPNMILVGGITTRPARPLPSHIKIFMDSAVNGVVIVSFGSHVKYIPTELLETFVHMFGTFKDVKFVFRYGNATLIDRNVMFLPWMPQNDILGHPNTRAFITHCGNGAQFEALYHGVPMLGMPLWSDQPYNALRMKTKGYGLYLDVVKFSKEELVQSLDEILTNPVYTETIRAASAIFRGRPDTPGQRAACWIHHVIKYGGSHLRPSAAKMPYFQYLLLDVILFLSALLITSIVLICMMLNICLHQFRRKREKVD